MKKSVYLCELVKYTKVQVLFFESNILEDFMQSIRDFLYLNRKDFLHRSKN